jgi:hypothetical protein
MTRTSIERCAIAFIIALTCVFVWSVYTVVEKMGFGF